MAYQDLKPGVCQTVVSVTLAVLIVANLITTTQTVVADCPDHDHQLRTYSINSVPKFSSLPQQPAAVRKELPVLSPSLTGYELNKLGEDGLLAQDDQRVVDYLWDHCDIFLRPPNGEKCATNYYQQRRRSRGQAAIVRKLLGDVRKGFYVEAGALDGLQGSNSLQFEAEFGWSGLLLEPDPSNLRNMYKCGRNAWISHSCLSPAPYPQEVVFQPDFSEGRIVDPGSTVKFKSFAKEMGQRRRRAQPQIKVQCFPLYSYLAALNVSTVDYFSLDIEGHELAVLKTIPFDKVHIRVLSVEFLHSPGGEGPIREYMESKGYITAHRYIRRRIPFDLIFVHKSVQVPPGVLEELAVGL